jgi:uncharacterized protein YodC (DUF2158 family)
VATIRQGDVVRLKSGGLKMTVGDIEKSIAYCFYFDKNGNKQNMQVDVNSIQKVSWFGRLFGR